MACGSQVVRGHGKERKAHQPSPASAWATPRSVLTYSPYVCPLTPFPLHVGLLLRPWNISCFSAHASTLNTVHYTSRLSTLAITTLDLPTHPPGGLRRPPLLATCCYQERWMPEAARRVGRSSVVMARAESRERSAVY
ncbi:hypothetical protein E2C01_038906 [Portunus trituberculatus]|uniref:Uncharacterized protein n=1 Tax=Portunus trituberculatus TaxID=210409 RepID=A0A5B7FLB3_PORTR|nr:hypothetical protein [Portunus trituberculatus]